MLLKTFSFDIKAIQKIKHLYKDGNLEIVKNVDKLMKDANQALSSGPFSVTFKEMTAPSGNKHDYVSLSRYKWPNPNTSNGLPYVKRDGESNPELEQYDRKPLGELCDCVSNLALSYYLTDEEKYANHAVKLLRTWFLNVETRMNPNFNHGSFVPGVNDGSKGGMIAGVQFLRLVNSMYFLEDYTPWTDKDQDELKKWFKDLRDWFLTSDFGKKELSSKNNHGIWADAQLVGFSIFIGDENMAYKHINRYTLDRYIDHFGPDGSQPNELRRTNSKTYCEYNLNAWIEVATFANHVGFDLWNYETEDGKSIRKAIDWFIPYILEKKKWIYQQIIEYQPGKMIPHLHRVAAAYGANEYCEVAEQLKEFEKLSGRTRILYVRPTYVTTLKEFSPEAQFF